MLGLMTAIPSASRCVEKPDPKKDDKKKPDSKAGAKQEGAGRSEHGQEAPDDKIEDAEAPPADDTADPTPIRRRSPRPSALRARQTG